MGSESAMCYTGSVINHVAQTLEDSFNLVMVALKILLYHPVDHVSTVGSLKADFPTAQQALM